MRASRNDMDALDLLRSDHERVSALFDQVELTSDETERVELIERIRYELMIHAMIEEKVFYPYFAQKEGLEDLVEQAVEDHQEIKVLLEEINQASNRQIRDDKLAQLMSKVELHIKDEEEDLFPRVEKATDTVQLMQLGDQLEEEKSSMPEAA